MGRAWQQYRQWLAEPVAALPLGVVRIVFGSLLLFEAYKFWQRGAVLFDPARFHFKYPGLTWVHALPAPWMQVEIAVWTLALLAFALGLQYRWAAVVVFAGFAHFCAIEASRVDYAREWYLLLLGWFTLVPAQCSLSLDRRLGWVRTSNVARWQIGIIQWHVFALYFFGGVAKLNADWFAGQPLTGVLARAAARWPQLGPVLDQPVVLSCMLWAGVLMDLLGPGLLLFRRTRLPTYLMFVGFHVINSCILFDDIGYFPWLALGMTLIFFPAEELWSWRRKPSAPVAVVPPPARLPCLGFLPTSLITSYVVVLSLLPFRFALFTDNVEWTREGRGFAWRLKGSSLETSLRFVVEQPDGATWDVVVEAELLGDQFVKMKQNPRLMVEFARHLRGELQRRGQPVAAIHAIAAASLNGRRHQIWLDPRADLGTIDDSLWTALPCVRPLPAGLPIGDYPRSKEDLMARLEAVHQEAGLAFPQRARWLLDSQDDVEAAEAALLRSVEFEPRNASRWADLGLARRRRGDRTGAIAAYASAVALRPTSSELQNNLGTLLGSVDPPRAFQHLQLAIELDPNNAQAHNNLANAYGRQGRWSESVPHYEQALRLQPTLQEARQNLALAQQQQLRAIPRPSSP